MERSLRGIDAAEARRLRDRADTLAALVPVDAWQTLSCGDGAKGRGGMTGR
jgi:hypothetical protein